MSVPLARLSERWWYKRDTLWGLQGVMSLNPARNAQCVFSQVHYFTQDDFAIEANRSKSWATGKQDPPLMFNIRQDPSETHTVHHSSNEYKKHIAIINAAKAEHLATIVPVCSQDKAPCGGNNKSYAVCGDHNSQAKYPQWPACTTTPANWEIKRCPS